MRILAQLALILVACTPYAAVAPITVPTPADPYAKVVRVLADSGETIETKDESAGVVMTKWEELEHMGTKYRLRWSIVLSGGSVTVSSQCKFRIKDDITFGPVEMKDCDKQPPGRS